MHVGSGIVVVRDTRIARVQSYEIEFGELPDKLMLRQWRWVRSEDLLRDVDSLLHTYRIRFAYGQPYEILTRFALLNKKIHDKGLITWVSGLQYVFYGIEPPVHNHFWIPEPWADAIIEAVSQGIIEIGVSQPQEVSGGRKIWNREAIFHDGTRKLYHQLYGHKFKVVE
jgi:hypothetical protein